MIPRLIIIFAAAMLYAFSYEEKTTLAAKTEKDECIELTEGTLLRYHFNTSLSVKFDLHSHVSETETLSLDNSYGTTQRGPKSVTIPRTGVYCFNWRNPYREDIALSYRIEFEEP